MLDCIQLLHNLEVGIPGCSTLVVIQIPCVLQVDDIVGENRVQRDRIRNLKIVYQNVIPLRCAEPLVRGQNEGLERVAFHQCPVLEICYVANHLYCPIFVRVFTILEMNNAKW